MISERSLADAGFAKQAALLFDRLIIWPFEASSPADADRIRVDRHYLRERGIAALGDVELPFKIYPELGFESDFKLPAAALMPLRTELEAEFGLTGEIATLRAVARAFSVPPWETATAGVPDAGLLVGTAPQPAAQVVLNALPMPGDDTPWEAIVDFRSDEDARRTRVALKRWMRQRATATGGVAALEDELRELLDNYDGSVRRHRLETRLAPIAEIVAGAVGAVAAVASGGPAGLAIAATAGLYTLFHVQVALVKAEQEAPGSEVAYVVRAREEFGG